MIPLLAVILGAVLTATLVAVADVRQHDQQVRERDADLEEWIVARHRNRDHRLNELAQERRAAGVVSDGIAAQALGKVNAIVLYDYREEKRQAEAPVEPAPVGRAPAAVVGAALLVELAGAVWTLHDAS